MYFKVFYEYPQSQLWYIYELENFRVKFMQLVKAWNFLKVATFLWVCYGYSMVYDTIVYLLLTWKKGGQTED